jgi:chemotaxis protein CheX
MTLSADSGMEVVSPDDIVVIAQDVWASFLELPLEPVPFHHDVAPGTPSMTGLVRVFDAWSGAVVLECAPAVGRAVAAAMFASGDATSDAEVVDALGELTNMIGGNIKSLLPAPSRLSLPEVSAGTWPTMVPGAVLVSKVDFRSGADGDPVHISVWQG